MDDLDELTPQALKQLRWAIRQSLLSRGGKRTVGRTDDQGRSREKVRHRCLFHDDREPSADYYPDDGWYYCHACGAQFSLGDVAVRLALEAEAEAAQASAQKESARHDSDERPEAVAHSSTSAHNHIKFGEPDVVYTYYRPGGSVSHYKLRWNEHDDEGQVIGKFIRTQGPPPAFSWRDVAASWPVYGDTTLWPGLNILVCEGEKAVDHCMAAAEVYAENLIVAVTCGSSDSLLQNSRLLADRLAELAPSRVLLWPDNDHQTRTRRWVMPLMRALEAHGVTVGRVELAGLDLPTRGGPDDYLAQGGRLADIFGATFTPAGAPTLDQLLRETVLTSDDRFLLPGTRRLMEIKPDNLETLWYRHTGGQVPRNGALKLLRSGLANRSADSRLQVAYRLWHDRDRRCLYWRPRPSGHCYYVDATGMRSSLDPPDTLLLVDEEIEFDPAVDEDGQMADLEELCGYFGLDGNEVALILGWLLCALVGLQTPIMVIRGESGAGKTTLARLLMAVIEPLVPYVDLPSDNHKNFDQRQLLNTLRRCCGAVLDNVTRFSSESEDMLSRLVTGYGTSQRRLHTEIVERIALRRAIIINTIHWDVKKGDLATRLLPVHLNDRFEYLPERLIVDRFEALVCRVRGHLFRCAIEFYRRRDQVKPETNIRVSDLGWALAALGYDTPRIAAALHHMRAEVLNETDFWLGAVVDLYRGKHGEQRPEVGDYFVVAARDILAHMIDQGCEDLPSHRSPAFARWLRERNPMFRDSGFVVEYVRDSSFRGWRFKTIRAVDWE